VRCTASVAAGRNGCGNGSGNDSGSRAKAKAKPADAPASGRSGSMGDTLPFTPPKYAFVDRSDSQQMLINNAVIRYETDPLAKPFTATPTW
jgi:hypothetical protein